MICHAFKTNFGGILSVTGDLRKGEMHMGKMPTEICAVGYLHMRQVAQGEKCTMG